MNSYEYNKKMKTRNFMNKKGLELAINTIVILVLAILVLIFLVLFFTGASNDFITKIKSYFSYSNVDQIAEKCNILADTNSEYSYCCEEITVKYFQNDKKVEDEFTCFELINKSFVNVKELKCEVEC